jgi:RecA-family ATPase
MDIRDQKCQHFEINFPKKIDEFFGHMAVLGPTGSGKGWWICSLILRMWQNTSFLQRRKVFYISAEATIDKTLDRLRVKRFRDWFFPIDVSFEAGEESGKSPQDFWADRVGSILAECRNCIVVLDDVQDSYGDTNSVIQAQNRLLRIGRHRNISVISVFHSIKNGPWTRQLSQSARFLVLFAKAQQGRVRDFFYETLGMPRREALQLTKHVQKCGRACIIRTSCPVSLICEKYLKLI